MKYNFKLEFLFVWSPVYLRVVMTTTFQGFLSYNVLDESNFKLELDNRLPKKI
jgi:hypothetical protein